MMKRGLLNSRRALVGVVVFFVLTSLLRSDWSRAFSNPPRKILSAVINPLSRPFHQFGTKVRSEKETGTDLSSDPAVLEILLLKERALNEQLRQQLAEAREVSATLQNVSQRLELDGVRLVPARVNRSSASPSNPTVEINVGSSDGVQPGFVVAADFNLVGRVVHSSPHYSTVALINAPKSHLAVRVVPPQATGSQPETVLAVQAVKTGEQFLAVARSTDPISVGHLAHLHRSDPNWPQEAWGLIVGRVSQLKPHPDDPTSRLLVQVKPIKPLRYLNRLVVIVPGHDSARIVDHRVSGPDTQQLPQPLSKTGPGTRTGGGN